MVPFLPSVTGAIIKNYRLSVRVMEKVPAALTDVEKVRFNEAWTNTLNQIRFENSWTSALTKIDQKLYPSKGWTAL